MSNEHKFDRMAGIDCSKYVEKKNGLSYLSWPWAVRQLLMEDPQASWSYGEPMRWNDTVMVYCTVTAFGKAMTMQLPVMDHRNKAIPNPDAFQVNTAMQRCLVKAIALHGLGLYIYAGEDLPEGLTPENEPQPEKKQGITPTAGVMEALPEKDQAELSEIACEVRRLLMEAMDLAAARFIDGCALDADHKAALWTLFDSKERSALKKAWTEIRKVAA
jgi:hypothetical protein